MKKTPFAAAFRFEKKYARKAGDGKDNGCYPFFSSSAIQNKYTDSPDYDGPSLIFGTGGKACIHYCENRFSASGDCLVAKSKVDHIDTKAIYYYLNSNIHLLESGFKGAGLKHISKGYISELQIPQPSLTEQKRIVAILDKADAIRRKRQAAIKLADDFLRATFLDMFGDPATNPKGFTFKLLSSLYSTQKIGTKCGPFGSALKKNEYVANGIPVWTMYNIKDNEFVETGCLFITEEKYYELEAYSVDNDDILISRAGTVGKMCIVKTSVKKSIISTNLIRLSLNSEKIEPIYFVSLMSFFKGKVGRLKTGEDGAYSFMNTGILNQLSIPLPPTHLQKQYTRIVSKVKQIQESKYNSLSEIDRLFGTLTQRAFRGELQEPQHNYRTPQIRQKMKKRQLEHRLANLSRKKLLEHRQIYNNFLGPRKKLTISQTLYDTYACENEYVFDAVDQFTRHTLAMLNPKIFSQEKTAGFPIEYRLFWHLFNTAMKYSRYYTGISGEVAKHPEIAYYTNPPISRLAAVTLSQLKNNFQLCAQLAYSLSEESFLNYQARLEEHTNLSAQAIKKTWIDSFNGAINELDPGKPLLDLEALQGILCYANLSGEFEEYDGLIAVRGIADNWLTENFYQTAGATELLILSKHLVEIKM